MMVKINIEVKEYQRKKKWLSFEIQVVMPQNYYSKQMVGAQVDQVKFRLWKEEFKLNPDGI